jgi:flagellar biosynthesis protein FlhF
MKSVDLTRAVDRFEQFRPARLLFTRMDETTQYGPVINEAARTGKPVSFLASGQLVPEDLVPASTKAILDLVMEGRMADLRIDGTGPAGVPQSGMATAA